MTVRSLSILALTLLAAVQCVAQTPVLLRDLNTQWPVTPSSNPHDFVRLGNRVVFVADGGNGLNLYSVDVDTGVLEDIDISTNGAANLVRAGSQVFFTEPANAPALPRQLWVTDGTRAGTRRAAQLVAVSELTASGNRVYFRGVTSQGPELWYHDGMSPWTFLPGSPLDPRGLAASGGGTVFFSGFTGSNGRELWRSDGTAAGTYLVSDINPGRGIGSDPLDITADTVTGSPGRTVVYFSAVGSSQAGRELWRSDGTAAGTTMVRDIWPGTDSSSPEHIVDTPLSTRMFFTADDGSFGRELWRTDGSGVTAFRVTDIRPGPQGSDPTDLVFSAGQLFFSADDGSRGRELWTSSAANPGANILDLRPGSVGSDPRSIASIAPGATPRVAFAAGDGTGAGRELWTSDASMAGTRMLADIHPSGDSEPSDITPVGAGRAVFAATGPNDDREVWIFDGGTRVDRLVDVNHANAPPLGSHPAGAVQFHHRIVFWANDGLSGYEPWITDGTVAGTTMLADVTPGPGGSLPYVHGISGPHCYFSVLLPLSPSRWELWKTDGTAAGTRLISSRILRVTQGMAAVGGELFFSGDDPATGKELWTSDGTDPGTRMVAELRPGSGGSDPSDFTVFRGRPWFTADDGVRGRGLWRLDANATAPILVMDFVPTSTVDRVLDLVVLGRSLLCLVDEGNDMVGLWISGGTRATTLPLLRFAIASGSTLPPPPVVVGDRAFFVANTANEGRELWVTDGTAAGTRMVKDIVPGPGDSWPEQFRAVGNRLFFRASDPLTGREPWCSDGTASGTMLLGDLEPGAGNSDPADGLATGSRLAWFGARTTTHGRELWRTDGTPAGTVRITDMMPRSESPGPIPLGVAGSRLVFAAEDPSIGRELFYVEAGATAIAVGESCARDASGAFELFLRATDPVLGTSATFSGTAASPGALAIVLLSLGPPQPAVLANCPIYLNPVSATMVGVAPVSANGQWNVSLTVPNAAHLTGLNVSFQAVTGPSSAHLGVDLTNAVYAVLGT